MISIQGYGDGKWEIVRDGESFLYRYDKPKTITACSNWLTLPLGIACRGKGVLINNINEDFFYLIDSSSDFNTCLVRFELQLGYWLRNAEKARVIEARLNQLAKLKK